MGVDLKRIGILEHKYPGPYLRGTIKESPEDFIVEEVWGDRVVEAKHLHGLKSENKPGKKDYVHFTLEKRDWDTNKLLKYLANSVGVSKKRFSYAGTKDKVAITAQRMSVWHVPPERLEKVNIKDCYLYDFEPSETGLELGDHTGNRFTITIRGSWKEDAAAKVLKAFSRTCEIPNFLGPQRFGTRLNSHLVGREMVKGDFEEAVKIYLTDTYNETDAESREAREWMGGNWTEFKEALNRYPPVLKYERTLLHHLAVHPRDFANSLRRLPRGLFKIFVHAYQGYIFNLIVSESIRGGLVGDAPVFGYDECLDGGELGKIEERILKKENLTLEDFRIKGLPEASGKGIRRPMFFKLQDFTIRDITDKRTTIVFSLEKGTYATTALLELGIDV